MRTEILKLNIDLSNRYEQDNKNIDVATFVLANTKSVRYANFSLWNWPQGWSFDSEKFYIYESKTVLVQGKHEKILENTISRRNNRHYES